MTHAVLFLSFLVLTTAAALQVNVTRLKRHITQLATHNDLTSPAVQRILYTPSDVSARNYLKSLFSEADLSIHEDPLGNIFATWQGIEPGPGVLTGSHFDAIPNSGMFDGTLGILSAVEAIVALRESGFVPRTSITVLAFTSEEPTRFGLSCIGSRLLANAIRPHQLSRLKDSSGIPFDAARSAAGYSGDIATVPLSIGAYSAFVELHSEQGPILEDTHTEIGAVTAIAAPAALSVTYTGPGGHAGTTLMSTRKDPSLAAAELSLAVEGAVKRYGGDDTVGTTGFVEITPNAVNSVPTMAQIGIDIRDIDRERRDKVLAIVENAARVIAKRRGVGIEIVVNSRDPPAICDDNVVKAVIDTANEQGLTYRKMISRAYHDALFMAGVIPTAMIFVPCRDGVSHRPDEFVADRDMENGVKVLAGVLKLLAGEAEKGKTKKQSATGKQAEEATEDDVKPPRDSDDKVMNDTTETRQSLATESGNEVPDHNRPVNEKAVETQMVPEVKDGEASESIGRNGAKLRTPSATEPTRRTRRSTSRKAGGSDRQKASESSEPEVSHTVENDSADSATKQETKKSTVAEEVGKDDVHETVKPHKAERLESVTRQPIISKEKSETESGSPMRTKIDPKLTESNPTPKAMESEIPSRVEASGNEAVMSEVPKAKKSKKATARKTRPKRAKGNDSENTASNASRPEDLKEREKSGSATGQAGSSDTKKGGEVASGFGIEGFDKSGNNFASEKDEL